MQEALPVALGLLISIGAMRLSTRGSRLIAMVPACVLAGAAASAIMASFHRTGGYSLSPLMHCLSGSARRSDSRCSALCAECVHRSETACRSVFRSA